MTLEMEASVRSCLKCPLEIQQSDDCCLNLSDGERLWGPSSVRYLPSQHSRAGGGRVSLGYVLIAVSALSSILLVLEVASGPQAWQQAPLAGPVLTYLEELRLCWFTGAVRTRGSARACDGWGLLEALAPSGRQGLRGFVTQLAQSPDCLWLHAFDAGLGTWNSAAWARLRPHQHWS